MAFSFLFFRFLFVLIGISSTFYSRRSPKDYYLASQEIPPWLVGLSAVATNNSGYMFIGVIGYTYVTGLASIWLMFGWISGDFLASLYVHGRLRRATAETGEASYAGVLSHWNHTDYKTLQRLASVVSLVFLLSYAGAQLMAGSKALQVLFAWPPWAGASMGAAIVTLYCLASGIRASIWTDAAQSFVMVFAMGLLMIIAVQSMGGPAATIGMMREIDGFLDWFPQDLVLPGVSGGLLFAMSWMFAGLSVIGQPHVMVRFMSLDSSPKNMVNTRIWYYGWFILFYAMATIVGMLSRIYLPEIGDFDAELALPTMAVKLLPPVLVGLIMAGMFAATMSTADSLILSCSASITHDLLPQKLEKRWMLRTATGLISLAALLLALTSTQNVFNLVILSWSALASAFGPLLLVYVFGGRVSEPLAIAMLMTGLATAALWRSLELHQMVYEGMPGILSGLLVYAINRALRALDLLQDKTA